MLFGLETAGGAPVSRERHDGVVQRTLNLRVKLLVFQLFPCNPFCGSYQ